MAAKRPELQLYDHAERLNGVVQLYLEGNTVQQIARDLSMPLTHVSSYLQEFKQFASNHDVMRQKARETVVQVDHHYSRLIKEAYGILEDAKLANSLAQRGSAVKIIADIETRRFTMMKEAGLLKFDDVMERLLEEERKNKLLVDIIREEVLSCPNCRIKVSSRLSDVTQQAEMVDYGTAD